MEVYDVSHFVTPAQTAEDARERILARLIENNVKNIADFSNPFTLSMDKFWYQVIVLVTVEAVKKSTLCKG